MTAAPELPMPLLRGEERAYFQAAREHRLVYQRCDACGRTVFYPRSVCPHCHSDELELLDSAGSGTVYSYTVQHRPAHPYFADATPQVLVLVELDEGFRLLANLVDTDPSHHVEPSVGMPVQAVFDDVSEELTLVRFRPREQTQELR